MIIGSLLLGLLAGTYLNIDASVLIAGGMILSILTPVLSPVVTVGMLGLGVALTTKNIIKSAFTRKAESIKTNKPEAEVQEVAQEAVNAANNEFKFFTSTMAFSAVPMMMLQVITSLSQFLLPVSVLVLFVQAWTTITTEPTKAIKYSFIALLIAAAAFLAISSGSASSVFLYFLTLVTIPSALTKNKEVEKESVSNTTMPLNAFLYGQGGNGSILSGMLLIQTILWGSGKDTLGTIVNGAGSMLLDPYRLTIFGVIIAFIFWFANFRKDSELNKLANDLVSNKKANRTIGKLVNLVSFGFALTAVNPFIAIACLIAGLIVNALVDTSVIQSLSIPMLLVVGAVFG